MSEKARAQILVSGLVQMVFFRSYTQQKARDLGLTGWVKNLADGRVEALFEGDRENIEKMIEWAKKGPPSAQVDGCEVTWQEYKGEFENFEIQHG